MRSSLKPHLLLLLMLTFFCTKAIPQDSSRSLIDKIIFLPDKVFAKVDKQAASFEEKLTVQTEKYLILPVNGSWGQKFGATNGTAPNIGLGGPFRPEGDDIPAPAITGNYKFTIDFFTGRYILQ